MKRVSILTVLCIGLVTGCSGFLDEKPQSDLTRPSLNKSEGVSAYTSLADAENELLGAYALFKADIYEAISFYINEIMTDNCYVGGDGVNEEQFDKMALTAINTQVDVAWSQYYAIAGAATNVIENLKLMKDDDSVDKNEKARIMAEACFIRAWAYFDIVRLWGDAPMTLELIPSITVDNLDKWYPVMYPSRTAEEEIYRQILEDLSDENITSLISSPHGEFRATKGAAHGLRAKVAATMGDKGSRNYQTVVDECDKVLGEGYALVEDFESLWTISGKMSEESIFELYFSEAAEQHNWAYWILLTEVSGEVKVTWRRYCTPTHDILKKFDTEKDKRYKSSIYWGKVPYNTYYSAGNYPLAYKIRQKESDIILMRLADILLLKAEALVELGNIKDAVDIVNDIRERAGLEALDTGMPAADARLAVENERQLELFLEGHRWYDLVRNGRMVEVMSRATDKEGMPMVPSVSEFRNLLPIPQSQIDINERLDQNIGY